MITKIGIAMSLYLLPVKGYTRFEGKVSDPIKYIYSWSGLGMHVVLVQRKLILSLRNFSSHYPPTCQKTFKSDTWLKSYKQIKCEILETADLLHAYLHLPPFSWVTVIK